MAVVATALTVTPLFNGTKQMTLSGTVAVNETVAVTVAGVNDVTDPDNPVIPAGLVLRLISMCGRVEYARFPSEIGDVWTAAGANVTCSLALNTANMLQLFRCAAGNDTREVEVELGNGVTSNLYGRARLLLQNWIQNPLDPVAGSSQIQTQIDNLTTRIEEHQHNAGTEGESAFPHNNLTGRDASGCHPTIESGVAGAAAAAAAAQGTADVASANATTALETAQSALEIKTLIQDGVELSQVVAASKLSDVKTLLNAVVTVLNTWRHT